MTQQNYRWKKDDTIAERYVVDTPLGKGGFAEVYRVKDLVLGRLVALKLLTRDAEKYADQFLREALTAARLDHPHIVPILEAGQAPAAVFQVMRYCQGGDLAQKLAARTAPLPSDEALRILWQIAQALDHAHQRHLYHRDVKPANILFDQLDNALLGDFGLVAAARDNDLGGHSVITLQTIMGELRGAEVNMAGTLHYMAPEQLRPYPVPSIASDVYSFAIVAYQLFCNQLPFDAENGEAIVSAHLEQPAPNILSVDPMLPPRLGDLLQQAMHKRPASRPQSVLQFAEELLDVHHEAQMIMLLRHDALADAQRAAYRFAVQYPLLETAQRWVRRAEEAAESALNQRIAAATARAKEIEQNAEATAREAREAHEAALAQEMAKERGKAAAELRRAQQLAAMVTDAATERERTVQREADAKLLAADAEIRAQRAKLEEDRAATTRQLRQAQTKQQRAESVSERWTKLAGVLGVLAALFLVTTLWQIGRSDEPEIVEREVTRLVEIAAAPVEVTRLVEMTVTPMEVTRIVEQEVILTEIVEATRLVELPVTVTPTPTPIPPTPIPTPEFRVGLEQAFSLPAGNLEVVMVAVPAGEFTMGSEDGDNDEQPVTERFVDDFWIDKTEVTNQQYAFFLNELTNGTYENGCDGKACVEMQTDDATSKLLLRENNYSVEAGFEKHPVNNVSWYGAVAYCEWRGARLPNEMEWEKAARGTDGRTYPWGEGIDDTLANYGNNVGTTTEVGSYPDGASPYGALDMAGNLWEWTADPYNNPYKQLENYEHNGETMVLRGGSWSNLDRLVRAANRGRYDPATRLNNVGFRCASSY